MLHKQPMAINKETKLEIEDKGTPMPKNSKKSPMTKKIFFLAVCMLFVAVTAVAGYSSFQLYKMKSPNYQKQLIEKQTKDIIDTVGKLIELPSDVPQIATVTDVDALKKNQPFFDSSKNGDQILIFQKEVILYRPSINKIINVGPIISTPPQTAIQQQSPAESAPSTTPVNQPAALSEPATKK